MNYDVVIGIEIHCELKTKTKMFSSSKNSFNKEPNTCVSPLDLAMPGSMPRVNKQAVILAIKAAHALDMEIDNLLIFDRKNYFYPDLPKGFQITQDKRPIGKNGKIEIFDENLVLKTIQIERLHLEEDTAKQTHLKDATLLDFNRSGSPLIEIVSKPQITSSKQAANYVEVLRSVVTSLEISDGKMEEGSLRCDINISLKEKNAKTLGTKVEIKNMNSISNIEKAIEFEIQRQSQLLDKNIEITQETRRYDDKLKKTISMREKVKGVDYKYFTEPNIAPIDISDLILKFENIEKEKLPFCKLKKYFLTYNLNFIDSKIIAFKNDVSNYFDLCLEINKNIIQKIANWINKEVFYVLNKQNISIDKFKIKPKKLVELILLQEENKITSKQAKEIFEILLEEEKEIIQIIKERGFENLEDKDALEKIVLNILDKNKNLVKEYKLGKTNLLGFFVGQVLKETKGKANPGITKEIFLKHLS